VEVGGDCNPAAIVGAWTTGDPKSTAGELFIFNADGSYAQTEFNDNVSSYVTTGLESGKYYYSNNTGSLEPYSVVSAGEEGLASIPGAITAVVDNDDQISLTYYDNEQGETVTSDLARVENDISSDISGAWQQCDTSNNSVFFDNGQFINIAINSNLPDVERGGYSWDSLNNDFTVTSLPIDQLTSGSPFPAGYTAALGDDSLLDILINSEGDLMAIRAFDAFDAGRFVRVGSTKTCEADSDGDAMSDVFELLYGFDPQDDTDALIDTDGDGLDNSTEVQFRSSPLSLDSDSDGLTDDVEFIYGLNPTDSSDALSDYDGDGFTNLDEFIAGTGIANPYSFPISPLYGTWKNGDDVVVITVSSGASVIQQFDLDGSYQAEKTFEVGESPTQMSGELILLPGLNYINPPGDPEGVLESDVSIDFNISNNENTLALVYSVNGMQSTDTYSRVQVPSTQAINDVWQSCGRNGNGTLVLNNDGTFYSSFPSPSDIETGTYSWDPLTQVFSLTSVVSYLEGVGGFSTIDTNANPPIVVRTDLQISPWLVFTAFDGTLRTGISHRESSRGSSVTCDTDQDQDGMPDWYEVLYVLNPYDPSDGQIDLDQDSLSNLYEFFNDTSPINSDTDGDGITDGV
jgi:hypothetical protein